MGNAEKQAKGYTDGQKQQSQFRGLLYLERDMHLALEHDERIESFRVRGPQDEYGEFMIVAKRVNGSGAPEVAFHSAQGLIEALAGFGNRLRNGSLKWVADRYAQK